MDNGRTTDADITIRRIAGHIGAEIGGADISRPLRQAQVAAIKAALLAHKVIFFRGAHLSHATQIAFARQFGELTYAHPLEDAPPREFPQILTVNTSRSVRRYGEEIREEYRRRHYTHLVGWHTDVTAAVNPPAAGILRADVVPEFGGDTQWVNLAAAYQGLSAPLRQLADGLRAVHSLLPPASAEHAASARLRANPMAAEHPVVRVHPETGERLLFLNPGFTDHIAGLSTVESRRVLDLFFEQIFRAEHTCRFRWEAGDVAFWDNRATAHVGPLDLAHLSVDRTLHRVTLIGDVPVGPDGRESVLIAGRPFLSESHYVAG